MPLTAGGRDVLELELGPARKSASVMPALRRASAKKLPKKLVGGAASASAAALLCVPDMGSKHSKQADGRVLNQEQLC